MSKNIHLVVNLQDMDTIHEGRTLPRASANMVAKRGWSHVKTRTLRSSPDEDGFILVNPRTSYPRAHQIENNTKYVHPSAVHETHNGKVSTGTLTQSKYGRRPKSNRYDGLEEVVEQFTTNLSNLVRQEVAALKSSSSHPSGLSRDEEEVYAPHLFD